MNKTQKTDRPTAFADLMRNYERNTADPTALHDLATACTYSVLKKVIDPRRRTGDTANTATGSGCNPALVAMYRQLGRDLANIDRIRTATKNGDGYGYTYNTDGDPVRVLTDPETAREYNDTMTAYATDTLTDALDLFQTAVLAILTETKRQKDTPDGLTAPCWLETPYPVRQLKRRVYIKTADSVGAWETVEVTPIQNIYKAVRRAIADSRAVTLDPRSKYVYLSDLASDPDSDETAEIYKRLPRYAQNVSVDMHVDRNGNVTMTAYTTEHETADTDSVIELLNLTARETAVLNYRLQGYGQKAIATALGVTVNSVKGCIHRIQQKAERIGLDPTK